MSKRKGCICVVSVVLPKADCPDHGWCICSRELKPTDEAERILRVNPKCVHHGDKATTKGKRCPAS